MLRLLLLMRNPSACAKRRALQFLTMNHTSIKRFGSLRLTGTSAAYVLEQVAKGRTFFVSRTRSDGRVIQASGDSAASVQQAFDGWRGFNPVIFEIRGGEVIRHKGDAAE